VSELIHLNNLVKAYQTEAGEFLALKNINLQIGKGEFVGVIGKSGSGKSTLINMITGIDRPTSGEVFVADTPIHTLNENQVAQWRGKNLGIVFQFFQLLPNLSVIDNVLLPMDFSNYLTPKKRRERAIELLDTVELEGQYDKIPSQLSGGQQQRVAIARALANDPPILFADEPTGNLDSKTSEKIFALFEDLINQGKTILMVTHDEEQAKRVNRAIIISDGEIIEEHIARTFPALSEQQLIWITRKLKPITYHQGEIILKKGEPVDKLYIITKGTVEIVLQTPSLPEMVVTEFGVGQYFGEIELMRGSTSVSTARAKYGSDVTMFALPKSDFEKLLSQSSQIKKEIGKIAKERFEENVSITKNGKSKNK
jgi:ABC-type lipoprotein export system ATPase subunit